MKININWLKTYIPFDFSADELAERLTMVGLEIEAIHHPVEASFQGVFVGEILQVENHPSATKLKVCTVDVGETTLSTVCGAPNVAVGQRVPVAGVGAVLADGFRVTSTTIRGVRSEGMICSERELGLSDDHTGILVLDKKHHSVGKAFTGNSQEEKDTVLEINVTPNRPDCLSHLGVAREVGVMVEKVVRRPVISLKETDLPAEDWVTVEIVDSDACPRYSARVVHDVVVGPSPRWLRRRLESVGVRSINNIVDVTNYVMMETGQPLHAFDYEHIQGKKIIVRKAVAGDIFVTLDGEKRNLTSDDLLICDDQRGIAMAGVMGGLNSEVSENTKTVLLESACFDPKTIRKTAKRLGITSEASHRFERGTDPNNTLYAVDRAAQLLSEVAGGKVARGVVDAYPRPVKPWTVFLRPSRIQTVLGKVIPGERIVSLLQGLCLEIEKADPLRVTVPTFRPDLKKEIDLIEEVARHYGYDKIEPNLRFSVALNHLRNDEQEFTEAVKDVLVGLGISEIISTSMVSRDEVSSSTPKTPYVSIQNPLSPETQFLRTSLVPGLLNAIRWNRNRSTYNLRFFEIGKAFRAKGKNALPEESLLLAVGLSGSVRPKPFWGEEDVNVNFFHLKGIVDALIERFHLHGLGFETTTNPVFEPETATQICYRGTTLGWMGAVSKQIRSHWDIEDAVFVLEVSMDTLFSVRPLGKKYDPIPRFPSIKRDLALVVDETVPVGAIRDLIRENGGEELVSAELFDLYRGSQVPRGKKSVAFSLTFLSPVRTMKEEEIEPIVSSILKALERSFSASLRS